MNTDVPGRSNPRLRSGKEFDIDWYSDISTYGLGGYGQKGPASVLRFGTLGAYLVGKALWHAKGGTDRWWFQDPGETAAVNYALRGKTYADIYKEACQ